MHQLVIDFHYCEECIMILFIEAFRFSDKILGENNSFLSLKDYKVNLKNHLTFYLTIAEKKWNWLNQLSYSK